MLERWLAFGVLVGLLLVFANWSNEDDAPPVAPRPADGLPPEMPEEDDERDERKRERERDDKPRGLVGGLLGE